MNLSRSNWRQPREIDKHDIGGPMQKRGGYGYYTGYPYILPFLEPINILAGLAFIAYLVQCFHTLFTLNHPTPAPPTPTHTGNPSLVGSVVDNLVPTRDVLKKKKNKGSSNKKLGISVHGAQMASGRRNPRVDPPRRR